MYVMRPQALLGSAFVALARHDAVAATALIEEARHYVEERRMQHFYAPIALATAFLHATKGEPPQALEQFNRAEQLALQMGMRPVVLQARAGQSQVLAAMERTAEAAAALQGARAIMDEMASLFKDSKLRELFLASASRKLPAPA
jgi:ATP/maltotriose-dependent transcriptional regulator MalT